MIKIIFYLLSLLPFKVLYFISDICYFFLYHIVRYRRKVVFKNIQNSFPNFSVEKRVKIEKRFYRNFCDNFIEMIKLISMNENEVFKRINADYSELEQLINRNENAHIYLGHQFNWELANAHISLKLKKINIIIAYKPIKNQYINKLVFEMRSRFGSKLVASKSIKKETTKLLNQPHFLILVADQNPKLPEKSFWIDFLSQNTPFISGSELFTISQNANTYFANIIKISRGYYKFEIKALNSYSEINKIGEITYNFAKMLEESITSNPQNYLWSHKRWKHIYKEEYSKRYIFKENHT